MTPDSHTGIPLLDVTRLVVDLPSKGRMKRILDGVDLKLNPGEILGLVGESGSGKSVLARTLIRMEKPGNIVSGSILFRGRDVTGLSPHTMDKIRNKHMSLVLQNPRGAMDPVFTLGRQFNEVLKAHAEAAQADRSAIMEKRNTLLLKAGIASPEQRCRQYPHQWSRGMLQRALLLMGFSGSPDILILDEVTSALDPTITLQIMSLIRRMKAHHRTGILFITHDLHAAAAICDRITVMRKGRLVETGRPEDIFQNPTHPYTRKLVFSRYDARPCPGTKPPGTPLIRLNNLSVSFQQKSGLLGFSRSFKAVRDISLSIHEGDTFCLIGESGSGKTTLMNAILGFQRFSEGTITYKDQTVAKPLNAVHRRLRHDAQVVFQDPLAALNPHRTIGASIREAVRSGSRKDKNTQALNVAKQTGLSSALLGRKPGKASLGQNQRVCLARALAGRPSLLFLDEPLSALDRMSEQDMVDILCDLKRETRITQFIITHDLGLVKHMGTRVAVMYLGRIMEVAPVDDFFKNPQHPYSRALLSSALKPGLWDGKPLVLEGDVPSPHDPPPGCVFHPRCPQRQPRCATHAPIRACVSQDHEVFCHLAGASPCRDEREAS